MLPKLINAIELHPSHVTWKNFLENHCTLKEELNGFKWYNNVNCHYIVSPKGRIYRFLGFNGFIAWESVTKDEFTSLVIGLRNEINATRQLCHALDNLTNSLSALREMRTKKD